MITSFFPGRIRLRAAIFKDKEITDAAIAILKKSDAIKNIEHNPLTGSVLLQYNPDKVPIEKLKPLLPFLEKLRKESTFYSAGKKPLILAMLKALETNQFLAS